MYLAVEVTSSKTFHSLKKKKKEKEKENIYFLPKAQAQHVFQKSMALLAFGFSVVTVEIS